SCDRKIRDRLAPAKHSPARRQQHRPLLCLPERLRGRVTERPPQRLTETRLRRKRSTSGRQTTAATLIIWKLSRNASSVAWRKTTRERRARSCIGAVNALPRAASAERAACSHS